MSKECPRCGNEVSKVIYMGLPGWLCEGDDCMTFGGLASYAPVVATETLDGPQFKFMIYTGSYWAALWHWLFSPHGD